MSQTQITDPNADYASPIPQMPKPLYLSPVSTPIFGTNLVRITGDQGTTFTYTQYPSTPNQTGHWGSRARHVYSKQQPWNSDMTLITIENRASTGNSQDGFPSKLLIDGQNYQSLYGYGTGAAAALYDYRWHPTDPNTMINVPSAGNTLEWWDVRSDTCTKNWTTTTNGVFTCAYGIGSGEGNPSNDGRYILLLNDTSAAVGDMNSAPPTLTVGATYTIRANQSNGGMSASGKYAYIHYVGEQLQIFDVDSGTLNLSPRDLSAQGDAWNPTVSISCTTNGTTALTGSGFDSSTPTIEPDMKISGPNIAAGTYVISRNSATSVTMSQAATGSGTNSTTFQDDASKGYIRRQGHADPFLNPFDLGKDYNVGQNQAGGTDSVVNGKRISHVNMISMETGVLTPLTNPSGSPPPTEISSHHISCRNIRAPNWVCVTWFYPTGSKRFGDEANFMMADGTFRTVRCCHTHSDTALYEAQKHGCPSPDGKRIIFASNWALDANGDDVTGRATGVTSNQQDYVISGMFDSDSFTPLVETASAAIMAKHTVSAY